MKAQFLFLLAFFLVSSSSMDSEKTLGASAKNVTDLGVNFGPGIESNGIADASVSFGPVIEPNGITKISGNFGPVIEPGGHRPDRVF